MQRLAPLAVGFLVTSPAIGSRQKRLRLDETGAFHSRVAGRRDFVAPEAEIVAGAYFRVVGLAVVCVVLLRRGCHRRHGTRDGENGYRDEPASCPRHGPWHCP